MRLPFTYNASTLLRFRTFPAAKNADRMSNESKRQNTGLTLRHYFRGSTGSSDSTGFTGITLELESGSEGPSTYWYTG